VIAGYLLSLGSFFRIQQLLFGNPTPLVLNATVGNILALTGSCFLSGPQAQYRRMWQPRRQAATAFYLGSLLVTIVVLMIPMGNYGLKGILLLLLMLIQYVAITWYCLSYVPFAQDAVQGWLQRRVWSDSG
jgi:drug/metabolite transporter (DMT)-like permease